MILAGIFKISQQRTCLGHFPLGGIFRAERHFLLFNDQLAESGPQKTKENVIPPSGNRPLS